MKALIIGATGATGKDLVSLLLEDNTISEVHSFVRRAPSSAHPKLKSHIVDFEQPDTWAELLHGDVAFFLLGNYPCTGWKQRSPVACGLRLSVAVCRKMPKKRHSCFRAGIFCGSRC